MEFGRIRWSGNNLPAPCPCPVSFHIISRNLGRKMRGFPTSYSCPNITFSSLTQVWPIFTKVTLPGLRGASKARCKPRPSLWSKQRNKGITLPFSLISVRVDPEGCISRPTPLHCPALCSSYWNIDFFFFFFAELPHTHWKINIAVHTTEQAAERGPTQSEGLDRPRGVGGRKP